MVPGSPTVILQREISRLAGVAAEKALAGTSATDELDRIAELQKVVDAQPKLPNRTWLWAILVAFVCLTAISLCALVRVPRTRIALEVTATTASLRLEDALTWDGAWRLDPGRPIRIEAGRIDPPGEFLEPEIAGRSSLDITVTGGHGTLRAFEAAKGALLSFDRAGGAFIIAVAEGSSRGQMSATGQVTLRGGGAMASWHPSPVTFDDLPGTFEFANETAGPVPSLLQVASAEILTLQDISVSGLGFIKEQASQQRPAFDSGVLHGSLELADTGDTIELANGSWLELNRAAGTVSRLWVGANNVSLKFEGTVHRIILGRGAFARDLQPTVLDYLFHQQKVGLLWGAVTFLWGLLWSARTLLLGS